LTGRSRLLAEIAILGAVVVGLGLLALAAQKLLVPPRVVTTDVSKSLDEALGPLILSQVEMSHTVLSNPDVDKAFTVIMDRLRPALRQLAPDSPSIRIVVIDSPAVNAFTLPGGIICVDTGLIRNLGSADQMAAVLGHELSHVAHRDPLSLLARQVGVAALAGLLTGGRGGDLARTVAQTLVNVHYGREAEDRADRFSVALLARADVSPLSFARALERIRKAEPKNPSLLQWIDPHSPLDERIARAREEAAGFSGKPRSINVSWPALIRKLPKPEG
jgi:Zn-dependent protease with chaperone function